MGALGVLILTCVMFGSHIYGSPMPATYDTIVIGLGPAGTSAASMLAQAGKKVLALEAQNRVGGRVNTVPFGDGVVELGAEWIHGTESSSVYELAMKNNVSIVPQHLTFKVYHSDGSSDREEIVNDLTSFALQVVDDPPKDPEPLGQYLTKRVQEYIKTKYPSIQNDTEFINSFLEFMDLVIDNYESSNSWNDVTTDSRYEELGGSQHMSWHKNGYKTLFDILLNKYNNGPGYPSLEIKLNTEVTKIEWPQHPADNVVVTVKDGTKYTARTAIITVSLGVLKERYKSLFSPPLPEQKSSAIDSISIGVCDKIILRYASRWWAPFTEILFLWRSADKASVSEADKWLLKINGAGEPMASHTTLVFWACGDAAKTKVAPSVVHRQTSLFSPQLPREKTELINAIDIGVVNKIVFLFDDVFWPRDGVFFGFLWKANDRKKVAASDWWTTKIFAASCPMGNRNVLTVWTSGDGAKLVESLPEDVVRSKVMGVIKKFMGKDRTIPEPVEMIRSNWYSNPFTRGSYSYDNIASPSHPTARTDLGRPLTDSSGAARLLFAGEATDPIHFSTVHGAVDSGRREAARLLHTPSKI